MKNIRVTATFDGLIPGDFSVLQEVSASTLRSAVSRAFAGVLKDPELKRKRIKNIHLDIEVVTKEE